MKIDSVNGTIDVDLSKVTLNDVFILIKVRKIKKKWY